MRIHLVTLALLPALVLGGGVPAVFADTATAMCEAYKSGEKRKKASGWCSFSQRQGYVSIRLSNGENWELSPADKPNVYRDQQGKKVVRSTSGGDHVYKWEHKKIVVSFPPPPAASAGSGHSPQQGHGPTRHS